MNAYEVYKLDQALRLHFTTKNYDFFKYGGKTRVNETHFNRMSDGQLYTYQNIASMKEPKSYLVGNYIFNREKFIRSFNNDAYLRYRKYNISGIYTFKEDLGALKKPFGTNFTVENQDEIPEIIKLYMQEKISLYTLCATRKLMDWTAKLPSNMLTAETIDMITKTYRFFKIDALSCKQAVIEINK